MIAEARGIDRIPVDSVTKEPEKYRQIDPNIHRQYWNRLTENF